ncbi:aminotransferase class V-fold PLP-dependent enzyme [Streptomyces sp. NPDC002680]|uniref:aminotransferase class V-fold PLP-dependent enzyme n=1 Tax=Streptomyces sp. NPDC002680 TaxID=3364659 RepID=UPI00367A3736
MAPTERPAPGAISGHYFDTASVGFVPPAVRHAVTNCYEALGRGTLGMARVREGVDQARELLGQEFGVDPGDVSFASSTGEAMNALARAVPWLEGDEVLTLTGEFPTVTWPWSRLGDGVRLVQVDPLRGDDRLGALLDGLTPRTRVVVVSHVSSFTGTRIDLDTLGRACARVNALLVCDGAQSAGSVPVALGEVDFYIATGYKWLLAGFGIAVVISSAAVRDGLRPTLLGHANLPPSTRLGCGTPNFGGIHALRAAAAVRREFGFQAVHERVAALSHSIHLDCTRLGLVPVADPSRMGGIVSLSAVADVPAAVRALAANGVTAADRGGLLRLSPHFYTTDTDIDILMHSLAALPTA